MESDIIYSRGEYDLEKYISENTFRKTIAVKDAVIEGMIHQVQASKDEVEALKDKLTALLLGLGCERVDELLTKSPEFLQILGKGIVGHPKFKGIK